MFHVALRAGAVVDLIRPSRFSVTKFKDIVRISAAIIKSRLISERTASRGLMSHALKSASSF